MLARKIRVAPEEFVGLRDRALALLGREAEDDAPAVRAFAQGLTEDVPTAETRVLAGPVVRRLLRESRNADTNRLIDRMFKIADPAFGANVRAWQASGSPRSGDSKHLEGTVLLDCGLMRSIFTARPLTAAGSR